MNKPPLSGASALNSTPDGFFFFYRFPSPNGESAREWRGVRPVPSTEDRIFHQPVELSGGARENNRFTIGSCGVLDRGYATFRLRSFVAFDL